VHQQFLGVHNFLAFHLDISLPSLSSVHVFICRG
jgi:hypothetical protein